VGAVIELAILLAWIALLVVPAAILEAACRRSPRVSGAVDRIIGRLF